MVGISIILTLENHKYFGKLLTQNIIVTKNINQINKIYLWFNVKTYEYILNSDDS